MWTRTRHSLLVIIVLSLATHARAASPQVAELSADEAIAKAEEDVQLAANAKDLAVDAKNQAETARSEAKEQTRLTEVKAARHTAVVEQITEASLTLGEKAVRAQRIAAQEAADEKETEALHAAEATERNSTVTSAQAEQAAKLADENERLAEQTLQQVTQEVAANSAAKQARREDELENEEAVAAQKESKEKQAEIIANSKRREEAREIRLQAEKESMLQEDAKIAEVNAKEKHVHDELTELDNKERVMAREEQLETRRVKQIRLTEQSLAEERNRTAEQALVEHTKIKKDLAALNAKGIEENQNLTSRWEAFRKNAEMHTAVIEQKTKKYEQFHHRITTLASQVSHAAKEVKANEETVQKQESDLAVRTLKFNKMKTAEEARLASKASALRTRELRAARSEENANKEMYKVQSAIKSTAEKKEEAAKAAEDAKALLAQLSATHVEPEEESLHKLLKPSNQTIPQLVHQQSEHQPTVAPIAQEHAAIPAKVVQDPAKVKENKVKQQEAMVKAKKLLRDLTREEKERQQAHPKVKKPAAVKPAQK